MPGELARQGRLAVGAVAEVYPLRRRGEVLPQDRPQHAPRDDVPLAVSLESERVRPLALVGGQVPGEFRDARRVLVQRAAPDVNLAVAQDRLTMHAATPPGRLHP